MKNSTHSYNKLIARAISALLLLSNTVCADILASNDFSEGNLADTNFKNTIGVALVLDTENQELDFSDVPGADSGTWVLDTTGENISNNLNDGNSWTISYDFRVNAISSTHVDRLSMRPGMGTGYESRKMFSLDLNEINAETTDKYRLVKNNSETLQDNMVPGQTYHIDIIINRSGLDLSYYNEDETLPDDHADIWLDRTLIGIDINLNRYGYVEDNRGVMTTFFLRNFTANSEVMDASFDNVTIRNEAYVVPIPEPSTTTALAFISLLFTLIRCAPSNDKRLPGRI